MSIPLRVAYFILSYLILCFGIALSNRCKLPITPTDLFPREMGMIQAIRMANGVASIVVTRHGAQASIPDRDEIDDLIWNY